MSIFAEISVQLSRICRQFKRVHCRYYTVVVAVVRKYANGLIRRTVSAVWYMAYVVSLTNEQGWPGSKGKISGELY